MAKRDVPEWTGKQLWSFFGLVLASVLGYFVITHGPIAVWQFFFGERSQPVPAATAPPSSVPPTLLAGSPGPTIAFLVPGHTGVITLDSEGTRFIAMSAQAYYDLAKAARLNDRLGILQMVADGRVDIVNRETKVLILDGTNCCPRLAQVRVQEGPSFGEAVWLPPEFVRSD